MMAILRPTWGRAGAVKFAIELDAITLQRGERVLLDGITWRVPAGACCAVLGPNGAGKSTLLAVVTGYLWPQEGTVRVLGERYGAVDLTTFRRRMGVLAHSRVPEFHPELSALETVLAGLWGGIIIPPHIEPEAAQLALARHQLEITGMMDRAGSRFGDLSTGEQMRTLLARAMVADPELLILDEPTAALDMAARAAFAGALDRLLAARPALAVAIVTHYVEDLPRATREVLVLRQGRVLAQGPVAAALTSETLSRAFGFQVELTQDAGRYWTRVRSTPDWRFNDHA
jgi:iron complex transport system ATP-binding protein